MSKMKPGQPAILHCTSEPSAGAEFEVAAHRSQKTIAIWTIAGWLIAGIVFAAGGTTAAADQTASGQSLGSTHD